MVAQMVKNLPEMQEKSETCKSVSCAQLSVEEISKTGEYLRVKLPL